MANKVLFAFMGFEALFVTGGIIILVVALLTRAALNGKQNLDNVANNLLLSQGPLTAAIVNAVFVFVTFLLCIPSIAAPTNRTFLKAHGYAVVCCAIFTLVVGLDVWFQTLNTRANLATVWGNQTTETQSLLQQRFNCCGYWNATSPPFIRDNVCTNTLVAANLQGCIGPFSSFANSLNSMIFTADFGIVAIDVILILGIACLLKDRKEKERYALIDAKTGFGPI
ncbi:hypothetical protein GJ744_004867 [Endocarpon pusillum]|uniref:Tetraspanin n=1 Tax=Endocarpon pusillum TaxID=364733 RepID=A0A8H7E6P1_9EURO|nr:hypothetical protein GJ744_004867 [Endocarpon pusillum]